MKKKLVVILIIIACSLLVTLSTVRFYDINDSKNYSSTQTFEEETRLKFYDLYAADAYIYSNKKIKLSDSPNLDIQFNINSKQEYDISSGESGYSYHVEIGTKENIPSNYVLKKVEGINIFYNYSANNNFYNFIVFENDFQYTFELNNLNDNTEDSLFQKVKDYILLNKEILQ